MLGLIWFNIRYSNAELTDKNISNMRKRLKKSTLLYKFIFLIGVALVVFSTFSAVFGFDLPALAKETYDKAGELVESKIDLPETSAAVIQYGMLIGGGIIAAASGYIVFFSSRIKAMAAKILVKSSTKHIKRQFAENDLDSKSAIITNLSNGKELGFSRDSSVVAVIPKKNEFVIFEMFINFEKVGRKTYPIFKADKAIVKRYKYTELKSFVEYFERGNYLPDEVKEQAKSLVENKDYFIKHGMKIEEVIEPQENTIIELQTSDSKIGFRAYKFKEILSGVYPKLVTKNDVAEIRQENADLKRLLNKYKNKLANG